MSRSPFAVAVFLFTNAVFAQEFPFTGVSHVPAPANQESPAIGTDGRDFLVAWRDNRLVNGHQKIFAARVGADGTMLDEPTAIAVPDGHRRLPPLSTNGAPAVAWTGEVYAVVWLDPAIPALQLVRIDRDGRVLDASPRSLRDPGAWSTLSAASSGDRALIVYSGEDRVRAMLLDREGNVARDFELAGSHGDAPMVAASSAGFLVVWRHWNGTESEIYAAPVSRDGVAGVPRAVSTTATLTPLLAANGNDFLLVHTDAQERVVTERLDANGNRIAQTTLSETMMNPYPRAALAAYRDGYLLVHSRWNAELRAVELDREGRQAGERNALGSAREAIVALAANTTATLAAWAPWEDGAATDIYARVVDAPRDPTLLSRAAPTQTNVRVASSGTGYLGVFLSFPAGSALSAARLAPDGSRLDEGGILLATGVYRAPRVIFDGRNYVVAWRAPLDCALRVNRITPGGALLDGVHGRVVAETCGEQFGLGSNGKETMLVWNGDRALAAIRMQQDGTLDPAPIRIPSDDRFALDFGIAWAADTWLVVWREGIALEAGHLPVVISNLRASRVAASGTVLDAVPITISETSLDETEPGVASDGRDFLVVWRADAHDPSSPIRARRVGRDGVASEPLDVGTGKEPSVTVRPDGYVIAWESDGDLFYAPLVERTPLRLAASADLERGVRLVPSGNGFAAAYERIASEPLYGSVPRAFLRIFQTPTRRRAVR